jgi:hypothetical protein
MGSMRIQCPNLEIPRTDLHNFGSSDVADYVFDRWAEVSPVCRKIGVGITSVDI